MKRVLAVAIADLLYLGLWVALARVTPAAPALDETTIGKLG